MPPVTRRIAAPAWFSGLAEVCGAALIFMVAACVTAPVPQQALNEAQAAIQRAAASEPPTGESSPELRGARGKLQLATEAVARQDMTLAARLAEQAELDAELASAKSALAKAREQADNLRLGNEALRQQSMRGVTDVAPLPVAADPSTTP